MGFLKKAGGGIKNLLLGKKESGPSLPSDVAAAQARARKMQVMGMNAILEAQKAESPEQAVARQSRMAAGAAEDARRQLQERIVRSGMGPTSLNLGIEATLNKDLADQQAELQTRGLMDERQRRAEALLGAGANVLSNEGTILMKQKARRQGGILPGLLAAGGAAVGGMYGGPAGASAGGQLGAGLGQGIQGAMG